MTNPVCLDRKLPKGVAGNISITTFVSNNSAGTGQEA